MRKDSIVAAVMGNPTSGKQVRSLWSMVSTDHVCKMRNELRKAEKAFSMIKGLELWTMSLSEEKMKGRSDVLVTRQHEGRARVSLEAVIASTCMHTHVRRNIGTVGDKTKISENQNLKVPSTRRTPHRDARL